MTERWYISVILLYDNVLPLRWKPVIPADLSGCHVFSYSLASGVRLPVTQMEIWCSTGLVLIVFNTSELVPAWILMQFHEDESNMSSAVLVYNPRQWKPLSWPSCLNTAELNLWLTINLKEPKHSSVAIGAWQRRRKNSSRPIRLPAVSLAPSPSVYLPPYASPPKNSLISNGLILCFHYGLCMFSLMAFSIVFYRAEERL